MRGCVKNGRGCVKNGKGCVRERVRVWVSKRVYERVGV